MISSFPKLIATSVVRGAQKGQSHGGVYTIDFQSQAVEQHIDWNTSEIDFSGVYVFGLMFHMQMGRQRV